MILPQDSLDSEMLVILKFLKAHETEGRSESTISKCSEPLTRHALACRKRIRIWKRCERAFLQREQQTGEVTPWIRKVVTCSKCQQPIVSGADLGYVCFKIQVWTAITFSTAGFVAGLLGSFHKRERQSRNGSDGRELAIVIRRSDMARLIAKQTESNLTEAEAIVRAREATARWFRTPVQGRIADAYTACAYA